VSGPAAASQKLEGSIQMQRWHCVHTLPASEAKAERHLNEQGFKTYIPRYRKTCRRNVVSAVLFPRYIFCAFDVDVHRWRAINGTRGVSYVICTGDEPTPVQDGIVERLQSLENINGHIEPGLRAILSAFSEVLASLNDQQRIALLFAMLDSEEKCVTLN
jgi:transcription antitermination factor NusG